MRKGAILMARGRRREGNRGARPRCGRKQV
jgi:hypothetical protein